MRGMRVRELILKPKRLTQAGEWKSGAKMPTAAFPLSKARPFRLGPKWTWRVDCLAVQDAELRLLTAFEPMKQTFIAWLALIRGEAAAIVARLEFHSDEPGWHCHSTCGRVAGLQIGIVKPYGLIRLPKARAFHRRTDYEMSEKTALEKSFGFFRVNEAPEDALV